jgi:hypothetical protein
VRINRAGAARGPSGQPHTWLANVGQRGGVPAVGALILLLAAVAFGVPAAQHP